MFLSEHNDITSAVDIAKAMTIKFFVSFEALRILFAKMGKVVWQNRVSRVIWFELIWRFYLHPVVSRFLIMKLFYEETSH